MYQLDYEIKSVHGHYEVYYKGEFYCSADTYREARMEIEREVK